MSYRSSPLPVGINPTLAQYIREEFRRLELAFTDLDNLTLPELGAEPDKLEDGMVVYADGTSWNPGSGEGFYGRENGAWVKL